jgi:cbb3-type cytochrome oxidase subunit 3
MSPSWIKILVLLLFFGFFSATWLWTYLPRNRALEALRYLPLEENRHE